MHHMIGTRLCSEAAALMAMAEMSGGSCPAGGEQAPNTADEGSDVSLQRLQSQVSSMVGEAAADIMPYSDCGELGPSRRQAPQRRGQSPVRSSGRDVIVWLDGLRQRVETEFARVEMKGNEMPAHLDSLVSLQHEGNLNSLSLSVPCGLHFNLSLSLSLSLSHTHTCLFLFSLSLCLHRRPAVRRRPLRRAARAPVGAAVRQRHHPHHRQRARSRRE